MSERRFALRGIIAELEEIKDALGGMIEENGVAVPEKQANITDAAVMDLGTIICALTSLVKEL